MKIVTAAAALSAAFFVSLPGASANGASADSTPPLIFVKATQNSFEMKDFPWALEDGRMEDVQVDLGKVTLTMPWMEVERDGDDSVTITAPDLMMTEGADWDVNGGLRAQDITMRFQRRGKAMVAIGDITKLTISDGDKKEARGHFDGIEFSMTASDYDLALVAMEAKAKAGSEAMRSAMEAIDLSLDYSVETAKFTVESAGMGSDGSPGSITLSSGESNSSLQLGKGRFRLSAKAIDNALSVNSAIPLSGKIALISSSLDFPVEASSDPQPMRFSMEFADVDVDETIWALADPLRIFPHTLDHVKADVELNVILKESLFEGKEAREARKLSGERPFDPVDVTVNALVFDGLGLDVKGNADMELEGETPTSVDAFLSISGLSGFMANTVKAGFLKPPQAIMAEGLALQFGKENEDGSLTYDVSGKDGVVQINGNQVPFPKMR